MKYKDLVKITGHFLLATGLLVVSLSSHAQNTNKTDTSLYLTLDQCIGYALKHQPMLSQSLINISIAKTTNAINLSGWLPQANVSGNLLHYNQLPTSFVSNSTNPGATVKQRTGVVNSTIPVLTVSQALFNPSLLYAAKAAPLYVRQAEQITDSTKIFLISYVSKSFYSLLLTLEQITVLKEDTARLSKTLSDAYHQFVGGIVDRTDYEQAAITLNNSKALLKQATENVAPQYAALKQFMGFPPQNQFNVSFDTTKMRRDIAFDTTQQMVVGKRIEYQQLQTAKGLQHQLTRYYRSAFLPTVSAFYNYDYEMQNNKFSSLFSNAYPYSYMGLSLSVPIFTGFYRIQNIHRARLQEQVLDLAEVDLKSMINTEYETSLANYKSNLYNLNALQENTAMAKDVYGIVSLQYQQGIVPYLNVITAESNLITSEIGYLTALFQVLSSKVDLEKSMGIITYNP